MNPTSFLFRSWFAYKPVFLMACALLFDEKIRQSAVLFWFGLRNVGSLYSQAVIQRTTDVSPAFLEHGSSEKTTVWALANHDPNKQAGGWINFSWGELRTLNSYQIFKIKKSKTYSDWCSFQVLSNGTTLLQIQSGRTVPLRGQQLEILSFISRVFGMAGLRLVVEHWMSLLIYQ